MGTQAARLGAAIRAGLPGTGVDEALQQALAAHCPETVPDPCADEGNSDASGAHVHE